MVTPAGALMRIARMEQVILQPEELIGRCPGANPDLLLVAHFNADCCRDQTALKLMRYEAAARRAYMQSRKQLLALQKQRAGAPKPLPVQPHTRNYKTKPISPNPASHNPGLPQCAHAESVSGTEKSAEPGSDASASPIFVCP
jgi:hypothetical protein